MHSKIMLKPEAIKFVLYGDAVNHPAQKFHPWENLF